MPRKPPKKSYGPAPEKFIPSNIEKYKGKTPIILRSKLEKEFARWIDRHSACVSWGSESAVVSYNDPAKGGKARRYFIDFTATFRTRDGSLKKYYIEIKPSRECVAPKPSKRKKESTFLKEQLTYVTNQAKWIAARSFAKTKGAEFIVITEKELHIQK
tara:strand:- start:4128 stop:4601 length:474 start_codon:yes stop_codon:yes gene_type:complete